MIHYSHAGGGGLHGRRGPRDDNNGRGKKHELVPVEVLPLIVPAMIAALGEKAALRFIDFFTAHIRNPNTRAAYAIAVRSFFAWLEARRVTELRDIRTIHVSGYIEALGRVRKAPTVKQHLAAIRMLFDFLIVGQMVAHSGYPFAVARTQLCHSRPIVCL
jgi:hypothetical protein